LGEIIGEVLNELDRLRVGYRHRQKAVDPNIWWASGQEGAVRLP
jgi:hypothetical protein